MTMRPTDDPLPRDPRFDAAWRTASDEEPSPALDGAILAAARREVGAKPQSLAAQASMRARRRWWPLAVAATVAMIAIGVVQRAGHDDLVPLPSGSTVVSDMPAQSAKSVASSASREDAQRSGAPSATVPLQKKAGPLTAVPAPSEKKLEGMSNAPAPVPEPFPAGKVKFDAAAARDAGTDAPASANAGSIQPAPAPSGGAQPSPQAAQRQVPVPSAAPSTPIAEHAAESPGSQRSEGGAASAKLAAPSFVSPTPSATLTPSAPTPMPPAASFAEGARVAAPATSRAAPAAKSALAGAADEARIKDRAPLPVADWIALIRRLRVEGNTAEAARELAAFRTAHADHERLLPPDLREWHPAEK